MTRPASQASGAAPLFALSLALVLCGPAGPNGSRAAAEDDHYAFATAPGVRLEIALARSPDGARFDWRDSGLPGWDTAVLGVRVDGRGVADPWIEAESGGARVEQHLDPAASGLRWVNLSRLREGLGDGDTVRLVTHGVSLQPGAAELRLFANQLDLAHAPILVLAPHPDDAEIAAFGLYQGSRATVVTVTSGNAGDFNYRRDVADPAAHYRLKGLLRAFDSVTVPWMGGIPTSRTANLGYFDARLREMHRAPGETVPEMYGPNRDVSVYRVRNLSDLVSGEPRDSTWAHLVEDLARVLERVDPAVVVAPYPQLDTHSDHQYTSVALAEALARWGGTPRFLLYTNHAGENRYPYGPAGTAVTLPPWSGAALPVQGLYSHPLGPEVRVRKLYALEGMHDLRLSPAEQAACATPGALPQREDYPRTPEVDYFRRAVRPDELFFAFDAAGFAELVKAFLAEDAPR